MTLLNMFFPIDEGLRTVVHAGHLIRERADGVSALRHYLRTRPDSETFLVHRRDRELERAAAQSGARDIQLGEDQAASEESVVAGEFAVALGARALDFAIGAPAVVDGSGRRLGELPVEEAEQLARDPSVSRKIREKLWAGCQAMRGGVSRVRIGHPDALARGSGTRLVVQPPERTARLRATEAACISHRDPVRRLRSAGAERPPASRAPEPRYRTRG